MALALKLACLIAYSIAVANWKHADSITHKPCSNNKSHSPASPIRPKSRLLSAPGIIAGEGSSLLDAQLTLRYSMSTATGADMAQPAQACHSNPCLGKNTGTAASCSCLLAFAHRSLTLAAGGHLLPGGCGKHTPQQVMHSAPARPLHLGQVSV